MSVQSNYKADRGRLSKAVNISGGFVKEASVLGLLTNFDFFV